MADDDRYRRFNLRIPKEAFSRLQDAADERSHSMNAEILRRIELSFSIEEDDLGKLSEWAVKIHKQEVQAAAQKLDKATQAIEEILEEFQRLRIIQKKE